MILYQGQRTASSHDHVASLSNSMADTAICNILAAHGMSEYNKTLSTH